MKVNVSTIVTFSITLFVMALILPIAYTQMLTPIQREGRMPISSTNSLANDGKWFNMSVANSSNFRLAFTITTNGTESLTNFSIFLDDVESTVLDITTLRNGTFTTGLINSTVTDVKLFFVSANIATLNVAISAVLIANINLTATDPIQMVWAIVPIISAILIVGLIALVIYKKQE